MLYLVSQETSPSNTDVDVEMEGYRWVGVIWGEPHHPHLPSLLSGVLGLTAWIKGVEEQPVQPRLLPFGDGVGSCPSQTLLLQCGTP